MAGTVDHIAETEKRIPLRLANAPNFTKFLYVFIRRLQAIDDIREAIFRERSLDIARGVNLDKIGKTLVFPRINNWDDELYRYLLRVIQRVRRSESTLFDIIDVGTLLQTESELPVQVIPAFPKALIIQIASALPIQKPLIASLLLDTVSATTGINVINFIEGEYFGFFEDPEAKGFNVGKLAELLMP